jgi:hypothetical protein
MTTLQQILCVIPAMTEVVVQNGNYDTIYRGICSNFKANAEWPGAVHVDDFLNSEVESISPNADRSYGDTWPYISIKLHPYCYIVTAEYQNGFKDTTVLKNFNFEELEAEWRNLQNAMNNSPAIKNYSIEKGGIC